MRTEELSQREKGMGCRICMIFGAAFCEASSCGRSGSRCLIEVDQGRIARHCGS